MTTLTSAPLLFSIDGRWALWWKLRWFIWFWQPRHLFWWLGCNNIITFTSGTLAWWARAGRGEVDGTGGSEEPGAGVGSSGLGKGEGGEDAGDAGAKDDVGRLGMGGDFSRQLPRAFVLPLFLFSPSRTDLTCESTSSLPSLKAKQTS